MNHDYADIRDLIDRDPLWFDEHAVPRYCEFLPRATANIYADEVVLMEIACQGCGTRFNVCMSKDRMDAYKWALDGEAFASMKEGRPINPATVAENLPAATLSEAVRTGKIHYGDPPNVACCGAGPTMNSVPIRVIEFWTQERDGRGWPEWVRKSDLEIDIDVEWARDWDPSAR